MLNEKLEKLSITDGLTEVYNRRYFNQLVERLWKEKMRSQTPLSLIIIDIDFFKKYNDFYGHQGGDSCLINVAKDIGLTLHRATDTLCRYGGEEFCVLIDGDLENAKEIAEQIQIKITESSYEHLQAPLKKVTLSMGVVSAVPQTGVEVHSLISRADEALYKSKEDGRNRYTVAE
ncbi:GGDEF domain-containing protein [Sulfurimonas sp.]|uniref:GGDEF domain-containing protein n=1 Tax=Sulfurimonas sp. TaxID=2022749 RepID=UPI003D148B79